MSDGSICPTKITTVVGITFINNVENVYMFVEYSVSHHQLDPMNTICEIMQLVKEYREQVCYVVCTGGSI